MAGKQHCWWAHLLSQIAVGDGQTIEERCTGVASHGSGDRGRIHMWRNDDLGPDLAAKCMISSAPSRGTLQKPGSDTGDPPGGGNETDWRTQGAWGCRPPGSSTHLYFLVSRVLKNRVGSEAPPGVPMTAGAVEKPSPQLAPVPPCPAPSMK